MTPNRVFNLRVFNLRPVAALIAAFALSACASVQHTPAPLSLEPASRAVPVDAPLGGAPTEPRPARITNEMYGDYTVTAVNVVVPETLRASEANRYLPGGDIVWREDPIGNRHAQVRSIVQNALELGVADMAGPRAVELDVVLSRFHALTEKARYTVGGVHAIQFTLQIRDAATGEIIAGPKFIKADFGALGGAAAIHAEAKGLTQKVRITNQLAYVIQQELTAPQGYTVQETGLMGALNQL
jgi:hypothetical protein